MGGEGSGSRAQDLWSDAQEIPSRLSEGEPSIGLGEPSYTSTWLCAGVGAVTDRDFGDEGRSDTTRFSGQPQPPFFTRPYTIESTSACQLASMMFSCTPTVPQLCTPSVLSIRTRTLVAVPSVPVSTRTL